MCILPGGVHDGSLRAGSAKSSELRLFTNAASPSCGASATTHSHAPSASAVSFTRGASITSPAHPAVAGGTGGASAWLGAVSTSSGVLALEPMAGFVLSAGSLSQGGQARPLDGALVQRSAASGPAGHGDSGDAGARLREVLEEAGAAEAPPRGAAGVSATSSGGSSPKPRRRGLFLCCFRPGADES